MKCFSQFSLAKLGDDNLLLPGDFFDCRTSQKSKTSTFSTSKYAYLAFFLANRGKDGRIFKGV
ncbi:hypothetical protein H6G04_06555 [Calothrix membranacea FACHB-236]|nr:hypothetical protein [Calothrix membranacea FACHB-236]